MSALKEIIEAWDGDISSLKEQMTSENRFDALLLLFARLRNAGFTISDVDQSEILLITKKLDKKFVSSSLNTLRQQFIILDIRSVRDSVLPTQSTPKVEEKPVVVEQVVDADDVLANEGFMEPPVFGERVIDEEFDKLIGYKE